MSKSKKVLFFDIDGTLLYAKGSGRKAFQDAFYETYNILINIDHINFSGATDLDVIHKLLKENKINDGEKKISIFFEYLAKYLEINLQNNPPIVFDGVLEFLEDVSNNWVFGIVTGNARKCADLKLKYSKLIDFFPIIGGYGDDSSCRNIIASIAINHMKDFSVGYLFGDTPKDIEAAKFNGLISVAVATGKCSYDELAMCNPDHLIRSFYEAKSVLNDT